MKRIFILITCFCMLSSIEAQESIEQLDSIMQSFDLKYKENQTQCEQNVPIGVIYNKDRYPGTSEEEFYFNAISAVKKAQVYNSQNMTDAQELCTRLKEWRKATADKASKALLKEHITNVSNRIKQCKLTAKSNKKLEGLLMKRYDLIRR